MTRDLRLNKGKTKCMLITRKRKPPPLDLKIDDVSIEQVNNFKYLGVVMSSDLSWSTHIASTCARAKKTIGLIYRTFRQAGPKCLLCLYKVLVRPILEYCCGVWDPVYSTEVARIEREGPRVRSQDGYWQVEGTWLLPGVRAWLAVPDKQTDFPEALPVSANSRGLLSHTLVCLLSGNSICCQTPKQYPDLQTFC